MESSEGRSALTDAAVAMVGFLTADGWLLADPLREVAVPYWALAVGIVVVASADDSILRRKPRFTTPADRVTLMRAVLVACCATMAVPALLCWRSHPVCRQDSAREPWHWRCCRWWHPSGGTSSSWSGATGGRLGMGPGPNWSTDGLARAR